jgi:hypothetical protein
LLVNQLFRSLSFNKNIELYFLTEEKVAWPLFQPAPE